MSFTGIKKRVACFYDNKGEFLGKKGFSPTDKIVKYQGGSYNVFHEGVTSTKMKRWYWDIEQYHYNIDNPNPINLDKKSEPILDAENYNIQLETKVARDLNNIGTGIQLNMKTILIGLAVIVVIYLIATGQFKVK